MENAEKKSGEENELSVLGQLIAEAKGEAEPSASAAAAVSPDVAALQKELEYERQRNASLQGRVDSQLRPLMQTVRELQQKAAAAPAAAPENAVTVQDLLAELTPEEREAVGEKQLAILSRLVEKPTQSMVDRVRSELQQSFEARIRGMEGQLQAKAGQDFWARVDAISAGVKELNDRDDPQWLAFLDGTDKVSGLPRRTIGNAAVDIGDVGRVAGLHAEFLKSIGKPAGAGSATATDRSFELRPEGSRAEPAVRDATQKPTLRRGEVEQFYKDLGNGKYDSKPEVVEKMEALITAALQDGRVLD
jgi:hypothetical protein